MLRVLVTGMSGTGKSAALRELSRHGHRVVDADTSVWSHWAEAPDGSPDWIWRPDAMTRLLTTHRQGKLFVAGTAPNQKEFYPLFEHVVLLSAPATVLLDRIDSRTSNTFGKTAEEREKILRDLAEVEPLLRNSATAEIDASAPLDEVVGRLEELALPVKAATKAAAMAPPARDRSEPVFLQVWHQRFLDVLHHNVLLIQGKDVHPDGLRREQRYAILHDIQRPIEPFIPDYLPASHSSFI